MSFKVTKALGAGRIGDRDLSAWGGKFLKSKRPGKSVNKKEILFSETMVRSTVKFNFQQLLDFGNPCLRGGEEKRLLRLCQGFGGQALRVYKKPD